MIDGSGINEHDIAKYFYLAPDAMLVYDKYAKIHFANLKVTTLFGYHYSELLGKSIKILFPADHLKQHPLLPEQEKGEPTQLIDRVLKRKNGSIVEMLCCEQLLPEERYEMVLYDSNLYRRHDEFYRTIRNEIYEKLFIKLRLFRHGEGMLMNMNRLALFIQNTDSLRKESPFDRFTVAVEEFQKLIFPEIHSVGRFIKALRYDTVSSRPAEVTLPGGDVFIDLSNRLKQLLDEISFACEHKRGNEHLDVIEKHRGELLTTITEMKKIIANTINTIEQYFICPLDDIIGITIKKYETRDKQIAIRYSNELDDSVAIINCSEMSQIIEILIENAFDILKKEVKNKPGIKPYIAISLLSHNNKIRIVVKDNGPGVPKEYQSLLFKDGFSTKGPGRGFGLSYAARCIRKYGGGISYEQHSAHGACFVIELLKAATE